MTKEQFYLHTLADHWQEMGYPYAADLLRHHANEGVPAFREIVGGSPQVSERAPQGGGPVIFGTPDLGGGHNQAKLTFYHVHPDGQQQRLGSVGFARPEGHAVMRTLQAAGHKGAEIDAARTLPEGWKAPKAHQSFLPTLNTARPEAPEQDWRPNEVLPEDYYGYSRKRKYARTPAQHLALRVAAHLIATGWEKAGHKTAAALLRHAANKDDQTATGGPYFGIRDHHSPQDDHLTRQPGLPAVRATGGTSLMRESGHIFIDSKLPDGRVAHASVEMPIAQAQWLMRAMHREGTVRNDNGSVWSGWFKKPAGKKTLPDLDTTPPEAPEQDYRPNEMLPEDFYGYSRKRLARAKARHDGRKAARKLAKKLGKRFRWKTLDGRRHQGVLVDIDNGTGIVRLPSGHEVGVRLYRRLARLAREAGLRPGEPTENGGHFEPEREPPDLGEYIANKFKGDYGDPEHGIRYSTGFLLSDGRGVPMGPGERYEDHRAAIPTTDAMRRWGWPEEIARGAEQGTRTPALFELMRRAGAVRVHASRGDLVLHLASPLTGRQAAAIRSHVESHRPHSVVVEVQGGGDAQLDRPDPEDVMHAIARAMRPRPRRNGRPYRAPAGGTVVRGVFYEGGSLLPDLAGAFATGQTPSRPAPPPKSRKINWAAALRRWTGRQRNR